MSKYYNPKRTRNIYDPLQHGSGQAHKEPFKLSRSKIELFLQCPRCFYLDRRLGVGRPPGYPFAINSAIDFLLKKEFDVHRTNGTKHPLIEKYGVDAMPVHHENLDIWRENFKGIEFLHEKTNFVITGAIDDLWINSNGDYIVVDYKATSNSEDITELTKDHHEGYKRQMEIYQWLLQKNGLKVSSTGYFVYANGRTDAEAFDGKVEFDVTLIPYTGDSSWVEQAVLDAHKCLQGALPASSKECDYCAYVEAVGKKLKNS